MDGQKVENIKVADTKEHQEANVAQACDREWFSPVTVVPITGYSSELIKEGDSLVAQWGWDSIPG